MDSEDDFVEVVPRRPSQVIRSLALNRQRFSSFVTGASTANGNEVSTDRTFVERFNEFRTNSTNRKAKGPRGRPTSHLRCRISCLKGPDQTRVTGYTISQLKAIGLGPSGTGWHRLPLSMTQEELDMYIRNLFPALGIVEFKLGKVSKNMLTILPFEITTPRDLKQYQLRGSALYIVPSTNISNQVATGLPAVPPAAAQQATAQPTAAQQEAVQQERVQQPAVQPTAAQQPAAQQEAVQQPEAQQAEALYDDEVELPIERAFPTPPIANRRPLRDASQTARDNIRNWVQGRARPPAAVSEASIDDTFGPTVQISRADFEAELNRAHLNEPAPFVEPIATDTLCEGIKSLAEIALTKKTDNNDGLRLVVRRTHALEDSLEHVHVAQMSLLEPLYVRFMAEAGVDDGGLTRELSSVCIKDANYKSSLLQGETGKRSFRYAWKVYDDECYRDLGQLTALLLLQGGLGLPVFPKSVATYILTGRISESPDDLPAAIKTAIQQLERMSKEDLQTNIDQLLPDRFDQGYGTPSTMIQKESLGQLTQAMVAYHVIIPQKICLDQFIKGLEIGGVLDVLQRHKEEAIKLFHEEDTPITMKKMESLLKFHYDSLEEGSNQHGHAMLIEQAFMRLLQSAASGSATFNFHGTARSMTLDAMLQWLTGASHVPAIGFIKPIDFYFDRHITLPRVNTCSLEVYLPLMQGIRSAHAITREIVKWIVETGQCFGQV